MRVSPLPIDPLIPSVIESLRRHSSAILTAEPGAGKTTRIPPSLVRAFPGRWLLLQPRRLAAKSCCLRILDEQGWALETDAGYIVRFENRTSSQTRLIVLTEGILNRMILEDPELQGVTGVILDEFHERSLHSDLAIALLKEIQRSFRPDLKILVMSATLDTHSLSAYLDHAPILQAPGNLHPVTLEYAPPSSETRALFLLPEQVLKAVRHTLHSSPHSQSSSHAEGAILVFLPGRGEIQRCQDMLQNSGLPLPILPLHGSLSLSEQSQTLTPTQKPRVILSTNIAETSLTIEDVRTVIDSGWARIARTDPQFGMDRLELSRISRASAIQRQGRAGRVGPGRCIRLYSEAEFKQLKPFELPEIMRIDLTSILLTLAQWGVTEPHSFDWFQHPPESQIRFAHSLLTHLGLLDISSGRITPKGQAAAHLPLHPRLATLFLAAQDAGYPSWGAEAAALLNEISTQTQDFRWRPSPLEDDLENALSSITGRSAQTLEKTKQQLLRECSSLSRPLELTKPTRSERLRILWKAYSDRLTRRRAPASAQGVMVGGRGVTLDTERSEIKNSPFWLSLGTREVREQNRLQAQVSVALGLNLPDIRSLAGKELQEGVSIEWNEARQAVQIQTGVVFRGLLLEDRPLSAELSQEQIQAIAQCLWNATASNAESIIRSADHAAATWLDRCRFLSRHCPEMEIPPWSEEEILKIFEAGCMNKKSLSELKSQTWLPLLQGTLSYDQLQKIEKEAPEKLEVPSGSLIRLDYSEEKVILAVRLQEVFGWTETPRIAQSRVRILLHLLSPSFRPVQVTEDLQSFWERTYPEVKKELKARYPKHAWPDNPRTAQAVAKGRPRQNPK